jgi:hypothetical protein
VGEEGQEMQAAGSASTVVVVVVVVVGGPRSSAGGALVDAVGDGGGDNMGLLGADGGEATSGGPV